MGLDSPAFDRRYILERKFKAQLAFWASLMD